MNKDLKIVVIDDNVKRTSPIIAELKKLYSDSSVILINDTQEALRFLKKNYKERLIVLLDLKLSTNSDGHLIFNTLRELTYLVPVIIWSAADEDNEEYIDFINKHAFAFLKQGVDNKVIIAKIKEAENWLNSKVSSVLAEWLNKHREEIKNKPYIMTKEGRQYTINEVIEEINQQTELGKEFEKNLIYYTIDKFYRDANNKKD